MATAEPFARRDVTIISGERSHSTLLYAFRPETTMHSFAAGPPGRGVLLPVTLRESMRLGFVTLALPSAGSRRVAVSGFVDEPMGAIAYTSLDQLADWTGAATPEAAASALAVRLRHAADRPATVARYAALPRSPPPRTPGPCNTR